MQIISQIVCTGRSSMTIKYTEKTDLWPLRIRCYLFSFRFQNIQDNWNSIFVVFSDDTLVCIGSIRFYMTTFLLASFGRLVIFKEYCFWIYVRRVAEKKSLNFYELDVRVDFFRARVRFSIGFLFWSNWSRLTQIWFVSWSNWLVLLAKWRLVLYLILGTIVRDFFSALRSSW
jgi:hypothetical protein